jgi:Uma2 family endonuclease
MAAEPKDPFRHLYTMDEYFALERTGDARYEYWQEIICVSGGSRQHVRISGNLYFALRQQLSGRNCEVFNGDLAIRTPLLPPYRYPDISVARGEAAFERLEGIEVLSNPMLIAEVLSPPTERHDRHDKRIAYQSLPSLLEYLLVAQDAPRVNHFIRQGEIWVETEYSAADAVISLPSVDAALEMSDVYAGV